MGSNVELGGLRRWRVSQITVGTTAVRIDSTKLAGRNAITVKAMKANTGQVYVSPSSSVTTSTGHELASRDSIELGLSTRASVWARASAAAQKVCLTEVG